MLCPFKRKGNWRKVGKKGVGRREGEGMIHEGNKRKGKKEERIVEVKEE